MNINRFRITIAVIITLVTVFVRVVNVFFINNKSSDIPNFSYILFYSVLIWTFNIYLYKFDNNLLLKNLKINAKYKYRILFNFIFLICFLLGFYFFDLIIHNQQLFDMDFSQMLFRGVIYNTLVIATLYTIDLLYIAQNFEIENEKLKNENLEAQLLLLKQQMRPHFLFNSLNTLKTLVKSKGEEAEEFIVKLSDLYRYSLQSNISDKITVKEELELLNAYIYMMKTRFEDNLIINVNIEQDVLNTFVPTFSLQTLVENCIKHNIISNTKKLQVDLLNTSDSIIVKNNLQPKSIIEGSNKIGLQNLITRYQLIASSVIEIYKTENEFIVKLPILK